MKIFEETGVIKNIERPLHESVFEDPNVLIPRRSQELGLFSAHYGVFSI